MSKINYERLNRQRAGSAVPGGPNFTRLVTHRQRSLIIDLCAELERPYPGIGPNMTRSEASELISNLLQRKRQA